MVHVFEVKAPFTQDAEHVATTCMQIMEHTAVNGSVHTAHKQHQRICMQICAQMGFRVLCELGLRFSTKISESRFLWSLVQPTPLQGFKVMRSSFCPVSSWTCPMRKAAHIFAIHAQQWPSGYSCTYMYVTCTWQNSALTKRFRLHLFQSSGRQYPKIGK